MSKTTPSELQLKMARNILDHIRRNKLEPGAHLTEQQLANVFQVSRSPIRGALLYLAEKGIIEQKANRGFFVSEDEGDLKADELELPRSAEEELCVTIARDYFEGKLPQSFSEVEIRRRYDLGRLVASRILLKLSVDGVISRNPGHGWRFEPTLNTQEAHDESYAFRQALEPAAILAPSFELDKDLAEISKRRHVKLLAAIKSDDKEEAGIYALFDIDAEFHSLIAVSSRNSFFQAAIDRQTALRRLVEYESQDDVENRRRMIESCAEHMEILAALEKDERYRAADLMRRHLEIASELGPKYQADEPSSS